MYLVIILFFFYQFSLMEIAATLPTSPAVSIINALNLPPPSIAHKCTYLRSYGSGCATDIDEQLRDLPVSMDICTNVYDIKLRDARISNKPVAVSLFQQKKCPSVRPSSSAHSFSPRISLLLSSAVRAFFFLSLLAMFRLRPLLHIKFSCARKRLDSVSWCLL